MSNKQQVEEMARDLVTNWEWMKGYDDYNDGDIMDTVATCKKMYEQGYQKVGEDKVVLPESEYVELIEAKAELIKLKSQTVSDLRKEIAKEFAQTLISLFWEEEDGETVKRKDVQGVIRDVLRMHYQAEVEQ